MPFSRVGFSLVIAHSGLNPHQYQNCRMSEAKPHLTLPHNEPKALSHAIAAVLLWSTVATAFKISLHYLTPLALIFAATLFSWLFLLGLVAYQGRLGEFARGLQQYWRRSLLLGAMNPVLYYCILFNAYARLPAQEAQIINYTWAMTMSLLAVPLLRQPLRRSDVFASVLCYGGVWVIVTHGHITQVHFSSPSGVMLALASTVVWALYWLLNSQDKREPVVALAQNFTFATPLALAVMCVSGAAPASDWRAVAGAAYVGLFEMGLTFVLWLSAMRHTRRTARIANLIFLSPALSLLFIHLLLKEPIYLSSLIGLVLIVSGLWWQKRAPATA